MIDYDKLWQVAFLQLLIILAFEREFEVLFIIQSDYFMILISASNLTLKKEYCAKKIHALILKVKYLLR